VVYPVALSRIAARGRFNEQEVPLNQCNPSTIFILLVTLMTRRLNSFRLSGQGIRCPFPPFMGRLSERLFLSLEMISYDPFVASKASRLKWPLAERPRGYFCASGES